MRKSKGKIFFNFVIIVVVLVALVFGCYYILTEQEKKYQNEISKLEIEIEKNQQIIYVAIKDISSGEPLVEDVNVEKQYVISGIESHLYFNSSDLGKIAVSDIGATTPIMKAMVTDSEIADDTRQVEMSVVSLMTDQTDYDVIDIRIMFPNGQDYVLLSKKTIENVSLENCTFITQLNEEEILRLSSALIDAYSITGTLIYSTRYIEPALQPASIPNYPVNPDVIELMQEDPNVLTLAMETMSMEARQKLGDKLLGLSPEQLDAVASGSNIADTAKSSVLLNGFTTTTGNDTDNASGSNTESLDTTITVTAPSAGTPEDSEQIE